MNTKKIITYIALTYGISWLIWLPNVLAKNFIVSWKHSDWLHLLGGLGPMLGAIITKFIFEKRAGVKNFFREKRWENEERLISTINRLAKTAETHMALNEKLRRPAAA